MPRKKVAILGGGVAALSAAFELTELDPEGELFDITVHTIGWRLGGKGAVGRNPDAGYRAEEHGLHVWTGFYDNAFQLVDRVYAAMKDLGTEPPFGSRVNAFEGINSCVLMEPASKGAWAPWPFHLEPHEGLPGSPNDQPFSTVDYFQSLIRNSSEGTKSFDLVATWPTGRPTWLTDHEVTAGPLKAAAARIGALSSDPGEVSSEHGAHLKFLIDASREHLKSNFAAQSHFAQNDEIRHAFILCEIALSIAFGMLKDEVLWLGFDCIDHLEWTDWMAANGCSKDSLNSAVVRGCYDYVFGFVGGNRQVGAGTGIRILLKLVFGYRGSFFYLLRATMGELIFAPLFEVLEKRKVKFNFFTRIDRIELSADGGSIETIRTTTQATVLNPPYKPLIAVTDGHGNSLPSWPSHPKFELLKEGRQLRNVDLESAWSDWKGVGHRSLKLGEDFDVVVLGIGLGAFATICEDLVDRLPNWKRMVGSVETTATMAFQAWTTVSPQDLGPNPPGTVLTGFAKPLDSWGDLSLMLPEENWSPYDPPKGLAYFCGSFPDDKPVPAPYTDSKYPEKELKRAKSLTLKWINESLPVLWPNIVDSKGAIRWDLFFDYEAHTGKVRSGKSRLDAQYVRANINPSDRYVLSVPGSVYERMRADESGVDNLYLAGDWVRTGINAGCIEAAVMAGRAAAGAIAGVHIDMPNATDFGDPGLPTALLPALDFLRKIGSHAVGGVGDIEAFCVLTSLPVDFVKAQLPDGLELYVPQTPTSTKPDSSSRSKPKANEPKMHEVVLIFGRQRNVRPGILPFGGAKYFEIAQLIPDVAHTGMPTLGDIPFSFMPNILLDSPGPVAVGRNLYGFNKQLAMIRADGDSFDVRSPLGSISAWFERCGIPGKLSQPGKNEKIAAIRNKLEQPLVGVAADGSFIYSILNFNLSKATFQPVKGTVQSSRPFVPKSDPTLTLDPNLATYPWGFRFLSQWSLSLPFTFPGETAGGPGKSLRRVMAHHSNAVFGQIPLRR
ncbi:MAG: FAD-dependent oxidoreductase [Bradyrhizobium sp.]